MSVSVCGGKSTGLVRPLVPVTGGHLLLFGMCLKSEGRPES